MNIEQEFINLLKTEKLIQARRHLYEALGANPKEINSYYLCTSKNLRAILHSQGIRCRNAVRGNEGDVSGSSVQKRRNKSIELGRRTPDDTKNFIVHSAINFFLNPINKTFWSFQRNALLRGAGSKDMRVVILELDLEKLLSSGRFYWTVSDKNLASKNPKTSFFADSLDSFDWSKIFSPENAPTVSSKNAPTHTFGNNHLAAELVFCRPKNTYYDDSQSVSVDYIKRIIVPELDSNLYAKSETRNFSIIEKLDLFETEERLLKEELELAKSLHSVSRRLEDRQESGLSKILSKTFENLLKFEKAHFTPAAHRFKKEKIARSTLHGVGHVTRVMFWAAFLYELKGFRDDDLRKTCLAAAVVHDLSRKTDREDRHHGRDAVNDYKEILEKVLPIRWLSSCLNAVEFHCLDDRECQHKDDTWRILKDADALDRGRFGFPKSDDNDSSGCDYKQLRLFDEVLNKQLSWLAFRLARSTEYVNWGEQPCQALYNHLNICCNLLHNYQPYTQIKAPKGWSILKNALLASGYVDSHAHPAGD